MIPVLFPDQEELVNAAKQALRRNKSVLVQAATGAGKTILSASMIHGTLTKGTRSMFVVPRKTLLKQTAETLMEYHIPFTFFAAGYAYNPYAKTILASAQTLAARMDKLPDVDIVFFDECHWGGAELDKVIKYYRAKKTFIIGLSATPVKMNGKGMDTWYDDMVCGKSVSWLMENNRLSDYDLFVCNHPTLKGNESDAAVASYMEQDTVIMGNAVSHYKNNAMGKLGITFGTSIKHCERIAEFYRAGGVPALCVHGKMQDEEINAAVKALARREVFQLVNCEIFTFGFDLASAANMKVTIESMHDLQPTKSLTRQLQKWGRVLRYEPGKTALIFDHAGNAFHANGYPKHGYPDEDREWTLDGKEVRKMDSERATPCRQCPACYYAHRPAPVCPNCSHVYEVKGREVDEVEGQLVKVDRKALKIEREKEAKDRMRRQQQARTLDELIELGKELGYKNASFWAARVWTARKAKR